MVKQPASVVHVRLPPDTLEALRKVAADKGATVHAEIIERLDASLAADNLARPMSAIRAVILAAVDHFPGTDPAAFARTLTLLKATLNHLLGMFGAEEPDARDDETARMFVVDQLVKEMKSRKSTPLGEAGRILLPKAKS